MASAESKVNAMATAILGATQTDVDVDDLQFEAVSLAGALLITFGEWSAGRLATTKEHLVEHHTRAVIDRLYRFQNGGQATPEGRSKRNP
jgi:hypothetical protein